MPVGRIVLVCRPAQSKEHAKMLEEQGYGVTVFDRAKGDPRSLREMALDAVLIDLGGAPASGRELGSWLRRQPATRHLPLVFLYEDPAIADPVRRILPDATFLAWSEIVPHLEEALRNPPANPIVPGAMDAYAGAQLEKKLGIREGNQVGLLHAPNGFEKLLSKLPEGAVLLREPKTLSQVLLLFVAKQEALEQAFAQAVAQLAEGGRLWICWPKKASNVSSDLTQQAVRKYGLDREMVDYKICSIDKTWSGLCFARRK